MSDEIVFVAAKRTPFGKFGGSLASLTATQLGTHASQAALSEGQVPPEEIDHVIFGNVIQSASDAAYLARHIGLTSGVPQKVPAVTLNRLCGSGFEAISYGVRLLKLQESKAVLVGGTENMSQCPYVIRRARFGLRMNNSEIEDSLVAGLYDAYAELAMSGTAEGIAEDYKIDRAQCDELALSSQKRAARATDSGALRDEIAPVEVKLRKKTAVISADEHIRAETTPEALAKLPPVFQKDGVVTAGNASGICDGAAALILSTRTHAEKKGWPIIGIFQDHHVVGCDPKRMGLGPIPAVQALLEKTGVSLEQIAQIEINEAFASQYLAVEQSLGLDREKTNREGGAIAIGHPLATTGARLVGHLLHSLKSSPGQFGLASACIGGGQGQAILIKSP